MNLSDLIGLRKLGGVDFASEGVKGEYGDEFEDCQVCRFKLDGVIYAAVEDPSDGYRSSMRELLRTKRKQMENAFDDIDVFCTHASMRDFDGCDILLIYDVRTAKIVLEVGTDTSDDYYPSFVANFHPENMAVNTK